VAVRVLLAGAVEALRREGAEAELFNVEPRVLTRQHEPGSDARGGERMGNGSKFDGFGPGADNQSDIDAVQLSP
jgi:hypothetical protein